MSTVDIVVLFLPVFFPIVLWLFKLYERSLPENKQERLDAFAKRTVRSIEQMYPDKPNISKKSEAIVTIQALFRDAQLTPPSQWSIEFAIEAAVYEIKALAGTQSTPEPTKPAPALATGIIPAIGTKPPAPPTNTIPPTSA
jgi:hypothetical protein